MPVEALDGWIADDDNGIDDFPLSSGDNRIVTVFHFLGSIDEDQTATFGGEDMVRVGIVELSGFPVRVALFYADEDIIAAASGTDIVVNHSGGSGHTLQATFAASFEGVDQVDPVVQFDVFEQLFGSMPNPQTQTDLPACVDGNLVIAAGMGGSAPGNGSWAAPLIEQLQQIFAGSSDTANVAHYLVSADGTVQTRLTWDGGTLIARLDFAAEFRGAASGSPQSVSTTLATATWSANAAGRTPGGVSRATGMASSSWTANAASRSPGGVTRGTSLASAAWSALTAGRTPGGVVRTVGMASATWQALAALTGGASVVSVAPALGSWSALTAGRTPGNATRATVTAAAGWVALASAALPGVATRSTVRAEGTWQVFAPSLLFDQAVAANMGLAMWQAFAVTAREPGRGVTAVNAGEFEQNLVAAILSMTPSSAAINRQFGWSHDPRQGDTPAQKMRSFSIDWGDISIVVGGTTGDGHYEVESDLAIVTDYRSLPKRVLGEVVADDHLDLLELIQERLDPQILGNLGGVSRGISVIDAKGQRVSHNYLVRWYRERRATI